jgi:L-threonylcarbamoyladenylate synthase
MLFITRDQIDQAVEALKEGAVIIYPTETSYGLGCDATNEKAVERIFAMKGRFRKFGLPVIVEGMAQAVQYMDMPEKLSDLAAKYWPGPLNIIATAKKDSPILACAAQDGSQSIRVSSHPIAATLVSRLGRPLVTTSANVSGQDAVYSVKDVEKIFANQADRPDVVLDSGVLPKMPASSAVKLDENGEIVIVRQGGLKIEV